MTLRRKLFIIFTLIWMAFIFSFSSRSGDVSSQDSNHVGMIIGEVFVPGFEQWNDTKQDNFADAIDHPIRKTAHAMEYAVLGLLTAGIFADGRKSWKWRMVLPWLIAAGYAATDEFHQLFVPGRSGQISDVLLDSAGALAGVWIMTGLAKIRKKKWGRKDGFRIS